LKRGKEGFVGAMRKAFIGGDAAEVEPGGDAGYACWPE
jgi:hypothetical protein